MENFNTMIFNPKTIPVLYQVSKSKAKRIEKREFLVLGMRCVSEA